MKKFKKFKKFLKHKKIKNISKIKHIARLFVKAVSFYFFINGVYGQYIYFSGENLTLPMFCPNSIKIVYDKESFPQNPQGVILYIDFDPNKLSITNFQFSNLFPSNGLPYNFSDGLYGPNSRFSIQRLGNNNQLPANGIVGTLYFHSKKTSNAQLSFWTDGTGINDNISDTDLLYDNGKDMLQKTNVANINFVPQPCQPDYAPPIFTAFTPDITTQNRRVGYGPYNLGTDRYVGPKISFENGFGFRIKDGDSYVKDQPGYISGIYPNLNITDYRANTNTGIFDNFNIADRSWGIDISGFTMNFKNHNYTTNSANISASGRTWNRRRRDYYLFFNSNSIAQIAPEENKTMTLTVSDNYGHTTTQTYLLNPAIPPWLTDMSPYPNQTQVLPYTDLILRIRDDRSGVDSGSIEIFVKSGNQVLYHFTGNKLNLFPTGGDADTPDFIVKIYSGTEINGGIFHFPIPKQDFVVNKITVQVKVKDNAGNRIQSPYDNYSFWTRYSCHSYGCSDPLRITLNSNNKVTKFMYLYTGLYVSGTDNATLSPDLNLLDCGSGKAVVFKGLKLSGPGLENNGENEIEYKKKNLFIIGGKVIYASGNHLVIKTE